MSRAYSRGGLGAVLLAGLLAASIPGASAHGLESQGIATQGEGASTVVFHAFYDASFDPFGNMAARMIIWTLDNPDVPIVDVAFTVDTNFADSHDVPVVSTSFYAESISTGVDFRIDGTQLGGQITASGHYEAYHLELTILPKA